jgi:excisionase family DNA binding protein
MKLTFGYDKASEQQVVWEDGGWFLERRQHSIDQAQQRQGSDVDAKPPSPRMVLRKAERDELVAHLRTVSVTLSPKEVAEILNQTADTVYRMVDRGDLGRVPHIRHVKIPAYQVYNLSQGLDKDGNKT